MEKAAEQKKRLEKRLGIYLVIVTAIIISLLSRLFYLQVVSAAEFQSQSKKNRIREVTMEARRGDIMDRKGQVLATSKPVFTISISNVGLKDQDEVIQRLVEVLADPEITAEVIKEKMKLNPRRYVPVEIKSLPWSEEAMVLVSRIQEHRRELPGVLIQESPMRYYPNDNLAGHLLGFVGQITERELEQYSQYGYLLTDKIGKTGVERSFELSFKDEKENGLRGQKGFAQVEVNAKNRLVGELATIPPLPGNNVVLTLDADLQRTMDAAMDQVIAEVKKTNPKAGAGAGVVLDVRTGAILAMVSKPDLNPNDFVDGSFRSKADYYNDDQLNPSLNRAIQGVYPPGSTFKMITGMAALESGRIKPTDTITCTGKYWKPGGIVCTKAHGTVDFFRAVAVSCNTYFQWAGEMVGIDNITKVAREFGLGEKTGLSDLGGEAEGVVPSRERKQQIGEILVNRQYEAKWVELESRYAELVTKAATEQEKAALSKKKEQERRLLEARYKIDLDWATNWKPYETYNTSIGQGDNNYTILQLANYVATIANGGTRYRPYLVGRIVSPDGRVLREFQPEVVTKVSVSPETIAYARRGMRAVTEPGGTAVSPFRHFPSTIPVAAKTGTAQTGRKGDDKNKDFFGLFVAFAPADNPQIAFAGVIEYAQSGGGSAGKVAQAVFEQYFGLEPKPLYGTGSATPAANAPEVPASQPSSGGLPGQANRPPAPPPTAGPVIGAPEITEVPEENTPLEGEQLSQ